MKFLDIATISICVVMVTCPDASAQIVVEPAADMTVIRYRDPAYGDTWREFAVSSGKLDVEAQTNVTFEQGTLRYEFVMRSTNTDRPIRQWTSQMAPGVTLLGPPEWKCRTGAPAQSMKTCVSDAAPQSGDQPTLAWQIESAFLPSVRTVFVSGAIPIDIAYADMPAAVKQKISEIEKSTFVERQLIVPWIPTMSTRETDTPIPVTQILKDVHAHFIGAIEETSSERLLSVMGQVRKATEALISGAKAESRAILRGAIESLRLVNDGNAWRRSLARALIASLSYLLAQIDAGH
jgi:hypothetical protein